MQDFFDDPDHYACGNPGVGDAGDFRVACVFYAEAFANPVAAGDDRKRTKRMHRDGVPDVEAVLIRSESREDGKQRDAMRMKGENLIAQGARVFRKSNGKSDEEDWLPKFRHLEPDEGCEKSGTCESEEATKDALLLVVAVGS